MSDTFDLSENEGFAGRKDWGLVATKTTPWDKDEIWGCGKN